MTGITKNNIHIKLKKREYLKNNCTVIFSKYLVFPYSPFLKRSAIMSFFVKVGSKCCVKYRVERPQYNCFERFFASMRTRNKTFEVNLSLCCRQNSPKKACVSR